jgi:hypothetical protein
LDRPNEHPVHIAGDSAAICVVSGVVSALASVVSWTISAAWRLTAFALQLAWTIVVWLVIGFIVGGLIGAVFYRD